MALRTNETVVAYIINEDKRVDHQHMHNEVDSNVISNSLKERIWLKGLTNDIFSVLILKK